MQFFPSLDVNPGLAFSANSGFGYADSKTDQDFSGVLSQQMDRHESRDVVPAEPAPAAAQESAEPPASESFSAMDDAVREDTSRGVDESARVSEDETQGSARPDRAQEDRREKAAGHDEPAPHQAQEASAEADAGSESAVEDAGTESLAGAGEEAGASGAKAANPSEKGLQEALAALVRQAGEQMQTDPEIAAGVEEIRELVQRFQQSEPSERKEQGAAIAAKIRALRERIGASRLGEAADKDVRMDQASGMEMKGRAEAKAESRRAAAQGETAGRVDVRSGEDETNAEAADGSGRRPDAKATGESAEMRGKGESAEAGSGKGEASSPTQGRAEVMDAKAESGDSDDSGPKRHVQAANDAGKPVEKSSSGGQSAVHKDGTASAGGHEHAGPAGQRETRTSGGSEPRVSEDGSGLEERSARQEQRTANAVAGDAARVRDAKAASQTASSGVAARGEAVGKNADLRQQHLSVPEGGDADAQSGAAVSAADGHNRQDAKQGFFSLRDESRQASDRTPAKSAVGASGKNVPTETTVQAAGTGQDSQTAAQQRLEAPVSAKSAEVYRQVESGAFRNLGQGVKQLVIRLDPAELGQISVILQVKGKEVQAVLRASNQETSHALGEQMSQLRAHLESQGLKVSRLEVQTQLADSQEQSQWQGAEHHNRYQENRELALSAQRWRNMGRTDSGLVRDVQTVSQREKLSQTGLDIFA